MRHHAAFAAREMGRGPPLVTRTCAKREQKARGKAKRDDFSHIPRSFRGFLPPSGGSFLLYHPSRRLSIWALVTRTGICRLRSTHRGHTARASRQKEKDTAKSNGKTGAWRFCVANGGTLPPRQALAVRLAHSDEHHAQLEKLCTCEFPYGSPRNEKSTAFAVLLFYGEPTRVRLNML